MDHKYLPALLLLTFTVASCANIFGKYAKNTLNNPSKDLLSNSNIQQREEADKQSCSCYGPKCMCCVDFNFTFVDLGGPGCVQMEYISQDEGLAVNVSFGEKTLHAQQVKGPNPPPTCMTLLKNVAQICARFSTLENYNDGLRGCLVLEPKVLEDIQTKFDIGCFTMGKDGMKIDANTTATIEDILADNAENTTEIDSEAENDDDFNEEAILRVVSETAQKGLAFFSNFLGLDFDSFGGSNETSTELPSGEENDVTTETA